MAKKKQTSQNTNDKQKPDSKSSQPIDLELLTHKYSDYFRDFKDDDIQRIDEIDTSYFWYDTKEVFYPMYKSKIVYEIIKEQPIHPIILELLKIIAYLETLQNIDMIQMIQDLTQLDSEILSSIVADLETQGLISNNMEGLQLSENGKEALKNAKEVVREQTSAFVVSDGIFGEVIDKAKTSKETTFLDSKDTQISDKAIELLAQGDRRLHTQKIYEIFSEDKTLNQVLREALQGLDSITESSPSKTDSTDSQEKVYQCDIADIIEVQSCQKYFKRYVCLFYKNTSEEEKILALDEKLDIDSNATKLFSKLIDTDKFKSKDNDASKDSKKKFDSATPEKIEQSLTLDVSEGKTLEVGEHKAYLKYVLHNAKQAVYIQSPWVRENILREYKDDIESALKRGVKVIIKYGLKPRNRFDKELIDEKSKAIFDAFKRQYPQHFFTKTDNDHSKICICDREFMIMGSFNWLSFGAQADKDNEIRGETSSINRRQSAIQKEISKFQ